MARSKATIMLDRHKAEAARQLTGAASISDVLDVALDRVLQTAQLRRDIAAYGVQPLSVEELAVADLAVEFDLADDDVDYDAIYGPTP